MIVLISWFLGIFVIDLIAAYAWVRSINKITSNKPLDAALWSTGLYIAGAVTVIAYTKYNWYLIPALLGSAIGTYLGVKHDNKK